MKPATAEAAPTTASASRPTCFCAYLALLPAEPTRTTEQLEDACKAVLSSSEPPIAISQTRTAQLSHPSLPGPLDYLELTLRAELPAGTTDREAGTVFDSLCTRMNGHDAGVIGNAELIHHLPSPMPLLSSELPQIDLEHPDALNVAVELFERFGLVVVKHALDRTCFEDLRVAVTARFGQCLRALRAQEKAGRGTQFQEIMQRDQLRFDCRLASSGNELWSRIARDGPWVEAARDLLGGDCKLHGCGVVTSLPGCGEQYWHSDGQHQGEVAGWEAIQAPSETAAGPHAICVFLPLVDLTHTNGYTEFWAGTHHFDGLLAKKGVQSLPGGTHAVCEMGDALMYDFRTVHRGMPNRSSTERPIMYALFGHEAWVERRNWGPSSVFDGVGRLEFECDHEQSSFG
eukprot:TRINITY_DN4525_c0_g1_i4.p1 TRINITY_DN4525_c0_g1~~TRINITY_DN4525_c0_g1_i4.p1  ORF type:complete len:402 (+),score=58.37 TRINITY_DN4525_c0_g1_i4:210-1415(+)